MNETKPRHVLTEMKRQIYFWKWIKFATASKILWAGENCLFLIRILFLCSSKKRFHSGNCKFHSKVLIFEIFMFDKTWVCVMRSNFTRYLHKSWLVVLRPKLSGNLKTSSEAIEYRMQSLVNRNNDESILCVSLLKLNQTWKYRWTSGVACRAKVNFCRSWKGDCDWLSGGNGMASSGKQALVGRRERMSLKAPAGEAITDAACVIWEFWKTCVQINPKLNSTVRYLPILVSLY